MILQKEIINLAEQFGVAKGVIDKDWILGHFISAIFSEPELREVLVFKGGTCLKKCWFPDYRFSEDLDFTSLSKDFELTENQLSWLCQHVREHAGISTHIASLRPIRFQDNNVGYEAIIKFWGADHSKNEAPPLPERWQTKIKIEIILYEQLVFPTKSKKIHHPYSDQLALQETVNSYAIEEVLSEKIRALIQRSYTAPRDHFDIWHLSNNVKALDWPAIVAGFHEKMKFKGLTFTGVQQLINPKSEKAIRAAWKNSLGHQINREILPDYQTIKEDLSTLFTSIF